jgi:hypothetical protein
MSGVTKERKKESSTGLRLEGKNNNKGGRRWGAVVGTVCVILFICCQQYSATAKLGLLSIGDTK